MFHAFATVVYLQAGRGLMTWARRVGGPGLIVLGLVDNSAIPIPGSQDALVIILSAAQKAWWPYYALMATAGAVIGGWVTYRLARREGREILEKRISRRKAKQVENTFQKWGFGAVAIPAMLPPPLPMFPFLLAAGALQYSRGKFITALAIGRGIRYTILAFLAAMYGREILNWIVEYREPVLIGGITAAVLAGIFILVLLYLKRSKRPSHQT